MKNSSITIEQAQQMLQNWQESGLSQKGFCSRENIRFNQFHYWKKKLSDQNKKTKGRFIKVLAPQVDSIPDIFAEVILPDGCRIVLHKDVSLKELRGLVRK